MNSENLSNPPLYEAAKKYNYSLKRKTMFLWQYAKTNVIIILLFLPEIFYGIRNFFFPPKPKCIANQVALITGSGNGLGRAIAFRLAREKCKLAIVDIDFQAAQQTAADIESKFNVKAVAFKVDVSNHREITQLKTDIEGTLGDVDILVNNAAILGLNVSLREGTPDSIQRIIDVNLSSHFWSLRTFLDGMIKRKQGHVVAISSFAGKITIPCAVAYCATKFGITGFMDSLYDELCLFEQDFIKTTTVFPTFVNTQKELCDKLEQAGVLLRLEPDHAAHLIVKAILVDQRKIYLPASAKQTLWLNAFPDRIIQHVKAISTDNTALKNERMKNFV